MKFVKEMISTTGMVEGIDYEIASILVEVKDSEFITLDEVFKVKSQVYFHELDFNKDIFNNFAKYLKSNKINYSLSRTRQPSFANCDTFYHLEQEIDFSSAYTFGFGVVKMIRGEFSGLYLLYNFNKVHDDGFNESDVIQEIFALKMYLQYVNADDCCDDGLESFIKSDEKLARALLTRNEDEVMEMFKRIYRKDTKSLSDVVRSQRSLSEYLIQ